jgi:AAA domain
MIMQIILNNFRGHNRVLNFGPNLNVLAGPNESGKSTVKEAIAFAWFGTDSFGASPDHLISNVASDMTVTLTTPVATVVRKKARGKTSTIKAGPVGLPGNTMNQTELNAMLAMTAESFMSCWNVGYFMNDLNAQKQLAVLGELAAVDRKALLRGQVPSHIQIPAKVKLVNPKIDADAMATERRQLQNVKASDEGALGQVRAQLSQLTSAEDVDVESYSSALNDLNAQLAAHDFYKQALAKYQTEKMRWDGAVKRKAAIDAEILAFKPPTKEQFEFVESAIKKLGKREAELRGSLEGFSQRYKAVPNAPKKPASLKPGSTCGTCGQVVAEGHVNHIMGAYENALIAHNKEAREVATFNDQAAEEDKAKHEELATLRADFVKLSNELAALNNTKKEGGEHHLKLQRELVELEKIKEPHAPEKPAGDEAKLREEQLKISTAVNLAKRQATQLEQLRSQEAMLIEAGKLKERQIFDYAAIEKCLRDLPALETLEILKTLEVQDVFVALKDNELCVEANGVPYKSLSDGKRKKVDLEFVKSLRRAALADKNGKPQPAVPKWIFLDNVDLIGSWRNLLPENFQVFVAKVDESLEELTVIS